MTGQRRQAPTLLRRRELVGQLFNSGVPALPAEHDIEHHGRTTVSVAFRVRARLILRRVTAYHLPNCLRMTVGSEEANKLVVAALAEFLGRK